MASVKSTLPLFLSVVVLLLAAVVVWQYSGYFQQRQQLIKSDARNRLLLKRIETVSQRRESFTGQLSELLERYQALRRQVPGELQLDGFRQQLEEAFQEKGLKILAQRVARYHRSAYQEIRLSYSLKGDVSTVQRVVKQLKAQPRLVLSPGAEKESDKNTGLVLSIFSSPVQEPKITELPGCLEKPTPLLVPLLNEELDVLYADYLRICHELDENRDLYRDMQRYSHFSETVRQLETIRDSLVSAR